MVDDDPIFRDAVENTLRANFQGADVVIAADGAEGLICCVPGHDPAFIPASAA